MCNSLQSLLLLLLGLLALSKCYPTVSRSRSHQSQSVSNTTGVEEEAAAVTLRRQVSNVTTESKNMDSDDDQDADDGDDDDDENEKGRIKWQCGTDFFTKLISESTVDRDCPQLKEIINSCCIAHDDCYDKQLGRTHCDDTFCKCLNNVTKSSRICNEEDSPTFCELVRQFGEQPYIASATTPAAIISNSTNRTSTTTSSASRKTTATSKRPRVTPKTISTRRKSSSSPKATTTSSGMSSTTTTKPPSHSTTHKIRVVSSPRKPKNETSTDTQATNGYN